MKKIGIILCFVILIGLFLPIPFKLFYDANFEFIPVGLAIFYYMIFWLGLSPILCIVLLLLLILFCVIIIVNTIIKKKGGNK
jgi:asparagine N-glycosylation enzyme membrane subunit Stt3